MDPDVTLAKLRELVEDIGNEKNAGGIDDLLLIADLFDSLDTHLSRGGFLPAAWARQVRL